MIGKSSTRANESTLAGSYIGGNIHFHYQVNEHGKSRGMYQLILI
jgi:hypothetical protein